MLINRSSNSAEMERLGEFRLPVHWRDNEKEWTTGGVFHDWFFNCFVPEVENYTDRRNIDLKILLIIDDVPCYPRNLNHPIIQPLNQGVIKTLKLYYIRRTLEFIMDRMHRSETSIQLLEEFSILDSVEILGSCVKDLQPSTLNVSWKRIWPGVVTMEGHLTLVATEIVRVLDVARALGGKGFVDTNEKDIYELIDDDKELDEEKLVQLADESASNVTSNDGDESSEETFDESEKNITLKSLNVGFELLARMLETHFAENDPSTERSAEFERRLHECLAPYLEIQKELEPKEQFLILEIMIDTTTWEDACSGDKNIVFKDEIISQHENAQPEVKKESNLREIH
ncbi:tigger transposable element-derived protein 1-like [Hylaeus volcanicus]|uniref:tigger transposable element-derived protein 1-like n=1 Tax=Hylaeus volcanicus TaxID=313075 RepID=UPI0023B7FB9B|nr:tigger transposable element-derived protein 1-like [Hylaeus volcanicus]